MKKSIRNLLFILLVSLFFVSVPAETIAISTKQENAIQNLLDDAQAKSKTPGMILSVVSDGKTYHFSSGYANKEKQSPVKQTTLFELASMSKAFTGLAILKLEDDGLLSLDDSISDYLPWLKLHYQGNTIDMKKVTLKNFLYHTSGLTNKDVFNKFPQNDGSDMLKKTIQNVVNTDLEFFPGEQYAYGTINYDILGLVIESVTNNHYETFMQTQIFQPLGLNNTYTSIEKARKTGNLAQGYRTSFFETRDFDPPNFSGSTPGAYIITDANDLSRWMNIQLGLEKNIPSSFSRIIKKSHQGNLANPVSKTSLYGAGWFIKPQKNVVEHEGANPTFRSHVYLEQENKRGVSLLANGDSVNLSLVYQVISILNNDLQQSYRLSPTQRLDHNLSWATIGLVLLSFFLIFASWHVRKKAMMTMVKKLSKRHILIVSIILILLLIIFWLRKTYIFVWIPYSLFTCLFSSILFLSCLSYFIRTLLKYKYYLKKE